ncbi:MULTISPECIES: hypothetical protein [Stenotrophomonas]|jgi:hypothetical protein|uniref:Uncharacterized protein n=1 Tax=Stenotrophomonas pavanii TaxID=487698 RepID=A0ABM7R1F5_9GAMM|nr:MULTISPECIES: hypothetical protein [Stenotrophomonas]MBH1388183.1 hypothetical protein [Stenotrophomonas maltophilia]MCF3484253.1 hypothetical protein [Stenotrophomonas maltophilia]MCO5735578.1 hypothetical protein [Stenotrophomonas maltophilia]MCW8343332.1 hypothetical protein [Stenotrophomonas sp. SG1]BCX43893.1 hypothetical protein STNY_R20920 [Stenotrophomonas pavanii]
MNTAAPTFIEFLDVMRDDTGLLAVAILISVVLLGALLSILIEHVWLTLRHWLQRRKGNGS